MSRPRTAAAHNALPSPPSSPALSSSSSPAPKGLHHSSMLDALDVDAVLAELDIGPTPPSSRRAGPPLLSMPRRTTLYIAGLGRLLLLETIEILGRWFAAVLRLIAATGTLRHLGVILGLTALLLYVIRHPAHLIYATRIGFRTLHRLSSGLVYSANAVAMSGCSIAHRAHALWSRPSIRVRSPSLPPISTPFDDLEHSSPVNGSQLSICHFHSHTAPSWCDEYTLELAGLDQIVAGQSSLGQDHLHTDAMHLDGHSLMHSFQNASWHILKAAEAMDTARLAYASEQAVHRALILNLNRTVTRLAAASRPPSPISAFILQPFRRSICSAFSLDCSTFRTIITPIVAAFAENEHSILGRGNSTANGSMLHAFERATLESEYAAAWTEIAQIVVFEYPQLVFSLRTRLSCIQVWKTAIQRAYSSRAGVVELNSEGLRLGVLLLRSLHQTSDTVLRQWTEEVIENMWVIAGRMEHKRFDILAATQIM